MMTIEATRDVIGASLRRTGLAGRGSVWRRRGSDVQWVVHIDQLPYGHRLGIDIGLDLQTESTPARPTDCAILLHVENLGIVDQSLILQALDLDSSIADADRRETLEGAASALGEYIAARLGLDAVRDAYRYQEFNSGFIRKDARESLESAERKDS
jgi:hypothetical protein